MSTRITFERLLDLYRSTAFDTTGDGGSVSIGTQSILEDLRLLDDKGLDVGALSGIAILDELGAAAVGDVVRARMRLPGRSLGVLARTFDDLLASPRARTEEPRRFYVVDGGLTPAMPDPPPILHAYRSALALTALLAEAAAYLDPVRQELMFVGEGRIPVPVRYDEAALRSMSLPDATALLGHFADDVHKEQKLSILGVAVMAVCHARAPGDRFVAILQRLGELVREVKDGYHLLALQFSYARIRRDVETAQFEYLNKIHKTFTDIQGQLLGIPVATFVVASQLKTAGKCDADLWTDVGVLGGAWIFVAFFLVAVANQWLTLDAVKAEVAHQQTTIASDYAVVATRFADVFKALSNRIRLHRIGLFVVAAIAVAGAAVATLAYRNLVSVSPRSCLSGPPAPTAVPGAGSKPTR